VIVIDPETIVMKKIVVKIGSSVIAPKGKLDRKLLNLLAADLFKAEKKGYKIVLVSSGAIACGLNELGYKRRPQDTYSLMAISSFGQIFLMDAFNKAVKRYKRRCAQVLLTWDDFSDRKRSMNMRKTIDKLLSMDVLPIVNENDAVSSEEIGLGDNDRLSAGLADFIGAQQLIMLSDVEGLLDGDVCLSEVACITKEVTALAKKEDRKHTSGGMIIKLKAANIAALCGIKTVIAYGREPEVVSRIISGEKIGTLFLPAKKIDRARKRWIAFMENKIRGAVVIDDGAKEALLCRGKSLLGVGIVRVEGLFRREEAVAVIDSKGLTLGWGLTNYNSEELQNCRDKKLSKEVIHRDNLALANSDGIIFNSSRQIC
jgi:glutamate 5-kinase